MLGTSYACTYVLHEMMISWVVTCFKWVHLENFSTYSKIRQWLTPNIMGGGGVKLLSGGNALPPTTQRCLICMLLSILPYMCMCFVVPIYIGISLWELEVDRSSRYSAMQTNFHTFSVGGKTYAVQFAK